MVYIVSNDLITNFTITYSIGIISVRPWQSLCKGLRVNKMGKLQDKSKLGKLGKFHVYSGNVHGSNCGSAHCSHVVGACSIAFLLR